MDARVDRWPLSPLRASAREREREKERERKKCLLLVARSCSVGWSLLVLPSSLKCGLGCVFTWKSKAGTCISLLLTRCLYILCTVCRLCMYPLRSEDRLTLTLVTWSSRDVKYYTRGQSAGKPREELNTHTHTHTHTTQHKQVSGRKSSDGKYLNEEKRRNKWNWQEK